MQYLIAVGLTVLLASFIIATMVRWALYNADDLEGFLWVAFACGIVGLFALGWATSLLERSPEAAEMFDSYTTERTTHGVQRHYP